MSTAVRRDQFKISPKGITTYRVGRRTHRTPEPPFSGSMNPSQLGNVLPNGEYRQNQVETLMEQLWAEYVAANPRLFEVHD